MPNDALPVIDFTMLVLSLSQTALVHLGEAPHPDGHDSAPPPPRNLALARQTIDLLGVLQDKTKGNLGGDEETLLETILHDLRMRFVELSKQSQDSTQSQKSTQAPGKKK